MTDREKLIELFVESAAMDYKDSAEYFLTNGVTVQKWIPSKEKVISMLMEHKTQVMGECHEHVVEIVRMVEAL